MSVKALTACLLIAALALPACNRSGSGTSSRPLLNIRSAGLPPDEFLVQPRRPLELPEDVAALPPPTPGARNRAEADPDAPMLAALGGTGRKPGIPADEEPLVSAAQAASGTTGPADIRATLAAEDAALRAQGAPGEQAGSVYDFMLLDPFAEAQRLRALGIDAPLSPQ